MLQLKRNQSAFTLIELLVVVIIVAILAAVGVPLLSANVARARGTEAETGLGAIRTALRTYHAENGTYATATFGNTNNIGMTIDNTSATIGDLDGQFFEDGDYRIAGTPTQNTFCVDVEGGRGTTDVPGTSKVDGSGSAPILRRSMNQNGTITNALCP